MRAISIANAGGPEVLVPIEADVPRPLDQEVLIRVVAAGVNRPDMLQREGRYPVPPDASPYPGLEVSGEVVAVGTAVSEWQPGDRVRALTHGGGYAEYCRTHEGHCLARPDGLDDIGAACIPETGFTVCYNVFMRGALAPDEVLLVHGGSSGIGSMAIQLATALGSRVVTTAGSEEKCRFSESLGAELAVNYRDTDWETAIREHLGGNRVNVVLDMVAGEYVNKNLALLARDGRYALIAFLGGDTTTMSLRPIVGRRLTLTGSTLRPQTPAEKTAIRDRFRELAVPLLEGGSIKPNIHRVFALEDARSAHVCMEEGRHMGKLALSVN